MAGGAGLGSLVEGKCVMISCDNVKISKMVKLIGMLLQTKIYLFWSKQIEQPGVGIRF